MLFSGNTRDRRYSLAFFAFFALFVALFGESRELAAGQLDRSTLYTDATDLTVRRVLMPLACYLAPRVPGCGLLVHTLRSRCRRTVLNHPTDYNLILICEDPAPIWSIDRQWHWRLKHWNNYSSTYRKERSRLLQTLVWYVLQITPRMERSCAALISEEGYEVFLPTYNTRRCGSCKTVELPLFPTYLFCRIVEPPRAKLVTTPGVQRVVGWGNTPAAIPDADILRIQKITRSNVMKEPWSYIPAGCAVRLENGPLSGLEGYLEQTANSRKLVVSIPLLQRSVAVTLDSVTRVIPIPAKNTFNGYDDRSKLAIRLLTELWPTRVVCCSTRPVHSTNKYVLEKKRRSEIVRSCFLGGTDFHAARNWSIERVDDFSHVIPCHASVLHTTERDLVGLLCDEVACPFV